MSEARRKFMMSELGNARTLQAVMLAGLGLAVLLSGGSARAQTSRLAATPPMGWNTWYAFGCHISEALVKAQADALIANGMRAAGYRYVDLDDYWQGTRDAQGNIHPSAAFPDMKELGAYLHAHGLKCGSCATTKGPLPATTWTAGPSSMGSDWPSSSRASRSRTATRRVSTLGCATSA